MYVCMYECMYVCMYECMYVCMYACMHVCMHACMYVSMYLCIYVCMYLSIYVCMNVWMYECMNVWMYVCMYVIYIYIYMCVCVCYMYLCISTTTATTATTTTTDFDKNNDQPLDFGDVNHVTECKTTKHEANNLALCSMLGFREVYIHLFFSILYHIFGPTNMYGIWAHISCSDYMAMAKKTVGIAFFCFIWTYGTPKPFYLFKMAWIRGMDRGYGSGYIAYVSGVWIRTLHFELPEVDPWNPEVVRNGTR